MAKDAEAAGTFTNLERIDLGEGGLEVPDDEEGGRTQHMGPPLRGRDRGADAPSLSHAGMLQLSASAVELGKISRVLVKSAREAAELAADRADAAEQAADEAGQVAGEAREIATGAREIADDALDAAGDLEARIDAETVASPQRLDVLRRDTRRRLAFVQVGVLVALLGVLRGQFGQTVSDAWKSPSNVTPRELVEGSISGVLDFIDRSIAALIQNNLPGSPAGQDEEGSR